MPEFATASDGMALAFERLGPETKRPAIMLVHGFGSSRLQNWKSTGWYGGLTERGLFHAWRWIAAAMATAASRMTRPLMAMTAWRKMLWR